MDAGGCENQEGIPHNMRKKLALAVRSIQWSYAIFWSISSENPGGRLRTIQPPTPLMREPLQKAFRVLKWFDGYYNGDIKTRKTVQAEEVGTDEHGLQRSEQLRELFESLLAGESNPQSKRPSASISPGDLSDAEWYYLVCMSFTFSIGQSDSLPARTLKKNITIWLSNAHQAETKVFCRSLLAKSASIQTVVCFPHVGGVVEMGITEHVPEDPNLVLLMTTYLSGVSFPCPVDNTSIHVPDNAADEKYNHSTEVDYDMLESSINLPVEMQTVLAGSPNNGKRENIFINSNGKKSESCLPGVQEGEQKGMNCLDRQQENIHYHSVLSNLLKSSHQLILGQYFKNRNRNSCFTSWRKDGAICFQKPQTGTPQKLLKKVLVEVAKMHKGTFTGSMKDENIESVCQLRTIKNEQRCGLSEDKPREKIDDRFTILSSLVPTIGKVDKVSILDGTIEYLMELKRRINELEMIPKTRRKLSDSSERTSDNYFRSGGRGHTKKMKVCEIDDAGPLSKWSLLGESSSATIAVYIIDKEMMIELKFPSRDGVLLGIMEVMNNFHLDCNTFQSTNSEGILSVTIRSKPKGHKFPSTTKVKEALGRVIHNW